MSKLISLSPLSRMTDSRVKVVVKFHRNNATDYTRIRAKCPHSCTKGEIANIGGDGYTYPLPCPHCN